MYIVLSNLNVYPVMFTNFELCKKNHDMCFMNSGRDVVVAGGCGRGAVGVKMTRGNK